MKILHVVKTMYPAGVESWLMDVLRFIDRDNYKLDFLVQTATETEYNKKIQTLGAKVIPCLGLPNIIKFSYNFFKICREFGPYDIIHSHIHHASGYILFLSWLVGIPVRIAHCHSDTRSVKRKLIKKCYLLVMKLLIKIFATDGIACSIPAADDLFGPRWKINNKYSILHCGINLEQFDFNHIPIINQRKLFNIPSYGFVLGHIGRFTHSKNHDLIIRIAMKLFAKHEKLYLLLVGDGGLREYYEQLINNSIYKERVVFAGYRDNVNEIMMDVFDVFIFPSLYEGLGLALIEAQSAALPCVVSDVIPDEAVIVPELVTKLSLQCDDKIWISTIDDLIINQKKINRSAILNIVKKSSFNIVYCIKRLELIYNRHNENFINNKGC